MKYFEGFLWKFTKAGCCPNWPYFKEVTNGVQLNCVSGSCLKGCGGGGVPCFGHHGCSWSGGHHGHQPHRLAGPNAQSYCLPVVVRKTSLVCLSRFMSSSCLGLNKLLGESCACTWHTQNQQSAPSAGLWMISKGQASFYTCKRNWCVNNPLWVNELCPKLNSC